jgi:DNA-directed RNA polymerase specialized sigma24 family protein
VRPWAFAIARRLLIDGFRKDLLRAIGPGSAEEASTDPTPDVVLENQRREAELRRELAYLPPSQRKE